MTWDLIKLSIIIGNFFAVNIGCEICQIGITNKSKTAKLLVPLCILISGILGYLTIEIFRGEL